MLLDGALHAHGDVDQPERDRTRPDGPRHYCTPVGRFVTKSASPRTGRRETLVAWPSSLRPPEPRKRACAEKHDCRRADCAGNLQEGEKEDRETHGANNDDPNCRHGHGFPLFPEPKRSVLKR
jgi:hypothetical protein